MKSIFTVETVQEQQIPLSEILMSFTTLQIRNPPGYPEQVCLHCEGEMLRAFTFKKLCENSNKTWNEVMVPDSDGVELNLGVSADALFVHGSNGNFDTAPPPKHINQQPVKKLLKRKSKKRKPFSCKICDYRCAQKSSLKDHLKTHSQAREEVKILISSILVSNPYPSTVSGLKRDYVEQVGNHIPCQNLGYETLEEFLRSITDVLAISGSGNNTKLRAIINPKVAHIHKLTARQRKETDRYASSSNFYGPIDSYIMDTRVTTTNGTIENSKTGCVPAEVQNNLKRLIRNFGRGLIYQDLPGAYKIWFGKDLDFREFNYNNLLEMCNDLQNVFCCLSPNEEEIRLFDPSRPLPKDVYDYLKSCQSLPGSHTSNAKQFTSTSSSTFPPDFRQSQSLSKPAPSSQSTLLTKHARLVQSASSTKLPSDAKHSTQLLKPARSRKTTLLTRNERSSRSTLVTKHVRFSESTSSSSPPSDCRESCLNKPAPLTQSTLSTNQALLSRSTSLNTPVQSKHSSNSDITRCSSKTLDSEKMEYPPNVVKLSDHISREVFNKKNPVFIYITEIYDPSKFWIVLKIFKNDFMQMHRKMQYWSKFRKNFEMPEKCVRCGLYCAVPYKNEYFRGIVVKLSLSRHVAKVYLVDFGTVIITNSTELLFLHKEFGVLPQQAIRARLARVQPAIADSPWSDDASKSFLKQVSNRMVTACISKINEQTQMVELYLKDEKMTTTVNNILVQEGLATFDHEKQKEKPVSNVVPTVDFIHLYPTFNEIEQGLVPTANESLKMKKCGCGYDYIYPKYFNKEDLNITKSETLQNSSIKISQKPENVGKQNQAESLPTRKSLGDPAKCRLRLKEIALPKNPLHDEQLTNNTCSNLLSYADLDRLELPQNVTVTYSDVKEILELSNGLKFSQTFGSGNPSPLEWSNNAVAASNPHEPITSYQLNTSNTNNLSNLENLAVKQKLELYLMENLRNGNAVSLYYIKHLLHELQPLIYPIQHVYNVVKDECNSLPPHILQIFISNLLNNFDTGKLLELYAFVYQISSPIKNSKGTNHKKIIARTDFSGSLLYLYRLYDQVFVDMREMLQLTNMPELPLHRISNETDMADFIGSLLITTLIENPKLIQELERYKISFGDKLFFIKIQFIPKFYHIFANTELPQGSFEAFLKKIDINGHPW